MSNKTSEEERAEIDQSKAATTPANNKNKEMPFRGLENSQKLGLFSLVGLVIVFTQIFFEVSKQTANYSLQYYNGGVFPIPKTFLVVLTETTKLTAILVLSKGLCPIYKYGVSGRVTNSFFLFTLLFVNIINLPGGQINDSTSGRTFFSLVPPGYSFI